MRPLLPLLLRAPSWDVACGLDDSARQGRALLLRVLAARDAELHAHALDVAGLAGRVAAALGCAPPEAELIGCAGALHDVGKLALPDALLRKPGPLDGPEVLLMRRHSEVGEAIVAAAPALGPVAALVRSIHERWDGRGYPDGRAGETIPLGARVVAVCDAYSAVRQARPYGLARSDAYARAELVRCAGTQFDPRVVAAFCALI